MRLFDEIMALPGSIYDKLAYRSFSFFCRNLKQAQCFELTESVAQACNHVMSARPTTLLQALPLNRLPYKYTWVETIKRQGGFSNGKDAPDRMGCLFVASDDTFHRGVAYFSWNHRQYGVSLCPFALAFDWTENAAPIYSQLSAKNPTVSLYKELSDSYQQKFSSYESENAVVDSCRMSTRWGHLLKEPTERAAFIALEKRSALVLNESCQFLFEANALSQPQLNSYVDDLVGELPFFSSFLIMLNSKTILDRTTDDFTKLNRARGRNRKAPLKEFVVTRLSLSRVQANRAKSVGITNREQARLTLVRGHLKVRKTGVYWWSPHPRGRGSHNIRTGYKIT
jgi:hypothetical protein